MLSEYMTDRERMDHKTQCHAITNAGHRCKLNGYFEGLCCTHYRKHVRYYVERIYDG
jgi:hypothetical protein